MRTSLATRRLGTTDMELTTVGFGAWAIGGGDWAFGWGPQDDEDSIATIRHAVERGINWIDTAAVYGLGHSEEVVRRALRRGCPRASGRSSSPSAAWCGTRTTAWRRPAHVLRPESIRRECEASLRRLGVERIDLYQFHWPDETGTPVEDSWDEMARLVDEGKVRAAGVSNFDVGAARALRGDPARGLAAAAVLAHPARAAAREIPWCATHGTGVIVYSPMQSGLLTDRFSAERVTALPEDDWRRRAPGFQPRRSWTATSPCATRCGRSPSGTAPRSRSRRRLDPRLARGHRRDRRRAHAGAGGRLDRRRILGSSGDAIWRRSPGDLDRTGAGSGPALPEE